MKPRHAAALALVCWYLMVPPINGQELPIAQWNHISSFDTADKCEMERVKLRDSYKNGAPPHNLTREQAINLIIESECLGTDDPRLKGN
jgi:hypothetical protein